jgi:hypothetical protein
MCLLALVSSTPAESRTIRLSAIADKTALPGDGVEFLLMKVSTSGCWGHVVRVYVQIYVCRVGGAASHDAWSSCS